jgi:glycosyltransferase involved in cell wall biosynthesis
VARVQPERSSEIIFADISQEGTIEKLFEKVRAVMNRYGERWEIIFVNDGSLDRSEEILNRPGTAHREVKVMHCRRNFGQTAARMAGFDFATGDVIVLMDGDGQNDPEDIPRMLAELREGYDLCSGWRRGRRDNAIERNIPSILARFWLFAEGVSRRGPRRHSPLRRNALVSSDLREVARITEIKVNHLVRSCACPEGLNGPRDSQIHGQIHAQGDVSI